jgi:hypothetical protein
MGTDYCIAVFSKDWSIVCLLIGSNDTSMPKLAVRVWGRGVIEVKLHTLSVH